MPKKRMPAAERQQESGAISPGASAGRPSYNWPDTGPVPGRESALTWAGELLERGGQGAGTEGQVRRDDGLQLFHPGMGWQYLGHPGGG